MQPQNECIFDTKYSLLLFNLSQVLIGVCIIGVSLCAAAVENMFVQCSAVQYSTVQMRRDAARVFVSSDGEN